MKDLTKSSLIMNETTIIKRTINGSIPVPDYWYTSLYVKKLFTYYYENNEQNIVEKICEVLKVQNICFTVDGIINEVEQLTKNAKKRFTPLYNIQESVKFYASEIETIKQLEKTTTQRIAFSILMLVKINECKGYKKEQLDYSPNAFAIYGEANIGVVCDALYELQQAGVITVPLTDYGLYCNIVAHDGEVVYEVKDDFHTSKKHFDSIFNKIILEVPVDSDDFTVHYGYKKINKTRKQQGKKPVHTSNVRNGSAKFQGGRLTLGGSYWFEINEIIAQDKNKQMLVANKLREIGKCYKKRKKEEQGIEQMLNEMYELIQELSK